MNTTQDVIDKTREYLNYIEDHYHNVSKAYDVIRTQCVDSIDIDWDKLHDEVLCHDLSKLSQEEFIPYRRAFYKTTHESKIDLDDDAWTHHKAENSHHWQNIMKSRYDNVNDRYLDLVHMIIDWTAMSYKFGGSAEQYYVDNRVNIKILSDDIDFINSVFDKIRK